MTARFANAEQSALVWTDGAGREWHGVSCHVDGGAVVIDADGDIARVASEWLAVNMPAAYEAPPSLEADYGAAVQAHVEATARSRGYHDAATCASYIGSTIAAWRVDAEVFIAWRDSVWLYVYAQLAAVQAEERAQPSIAELIGELPEIAW